MSNVLQRGRDSWGSITDHYLVESFVNGLRVYLSDRLTAFFAVCLLILILLAIFGPMIIPYEPGAYHRTDDGELNRLAPPSLDHPLGTNDNAQDVFSRLIFGTQATILIGFSAGAVIVSLGLLIGVVSGYFGGRVDSVLMRITDFAYGIPFIPTAILLIAFFGLGFWSTILLIGILLWRGNARVFRSQVLQIREREHVKVAQAFGASNVYVLYRHIVPNMVGMVVLFFALGAGVSILISASLAFLGFMNPYIPSWGVMLRNAYQSGFAMDAWWWTFTTGFTLSFTVLVIIMLGRGYERVHNEQVGEFGGV